MRTLVALLIAIGLVGCSYGPAPLKRGKLSGKVTLDGKPVAKGLIRFLAIEATATNVVAKVISGEYKVAESEGPTKGKYRVEFSVPSASMKRFENPDFPGKWIEEPAETLHPRYHRDSAITLDYDPENPQPFNYDLTSR
jgi:hypothetical protein